VPVDRSERDALVLETVNVAIELGADLNVASVDGRTALDSARAQKYEAVARLLEQRGAASSR
jgi:ankyrin repeat protein